MPYLSLYLKSMGYEAAQVGLVFAVLQGTKIIAPNVWAWVADVYQHRMRMVQIGALLSTLIFSAMLFDSNFLGILLISFVFSFFWNAMLPQFEAVTMTLLGHDTKGYSRVRLWGSVGFVLAVAMGGWLLDYAGLLNWPVLTLGCLALIFIASLFVREPTVQSHEVRQHSLSNILRNKQVLAFFAVIFLIQASHGPYYSFFSILLSEHGYSESEIGQLWSLGVVAEVALFFVMHHLFKFVSLRVILLISIVLTIVRWMIIAWFSDSLPALLVAQLFHAASFGAFHVVCIQLVHVYFKGAYQVRGQALYSSIGFGAGGMFGSLMAGFLWDDLGFSWVFSGAALLSATALWVAWRWLITDNQNGSDVSEEGLFSL